MSSTKLIREEFQILTKYSLFSFGVVFEYIVEIVGCCFATFLGKPLPELIFGTCNLVWSLFICISVLWKLVVYH